MFGRISRAVLVVLDEGSQTSIETMGQLLQVFRILQKNGLIGIGNKPQFRQNCGHPGHPHDKPRILLESPLNVRIAQFLGQAFGQLDGQFPAFFFVLGIHKSVENGKDRFGDLAAGDDFSFVIVGNVPELQTLGLLAETGVEMDREKKNRFLFRQLLRIGDLDPCSRVGYVSLFLVRTTVRSG